MNMNYIKDLRIIVLLAGGLLSCYRNEKTGRDAAALSPGEIYKLN